MVRRLHDGLLAAIALLALWPVMLVAAIGIRLSSPGPVLYRARRAGLHGREFTLLKFRTMHQGEGRAITAAHDERVFPFGQWLRRMKIDELPQLVNVLRGEMAIVGPRPEDPRIVREHYTPEQLRTLEVLPGLASPGSLYNYTHGEALLAGDDAEARYLREVLPAKLALDLAYMRDASLVHEWRLIARTLVAIAAMTGGRRSHRRSAAQARLEPGNTRLEHGGG